MAETGGHAFPTVNPTGVYHGPWAFQEASNPGLDFHRLDTDLPYAAQQAAKLAATGITHQKWETWPTMAQRFLHGPATAVGRRHAHPDRRRHHRLHDLGRVQRAGRNRLRGRLDLPAAHHPSRHPPRQPNRHRPIRNLVLHQPDQLPPRLQRRRHHGPHRHPGAVPGVRGGRHHPHRPVQRLPGTGQPRRPNLHPRRRRPRLLPRPLPHGLADRSTPETASPAASRSPKSAPSATPNAPSRTYTSSRTRPATTAASRTRSTSSRSWSSCSTCCRRDWRDFLPPRHASHFDG